MNLIIVLRPLLQLIPADDLLNGFAGFSGHVPGSLQIFFNIFQRDLKIGMFFFQI